VNLGRWLGLALLLAGCTVRRAEPPRGTGSSIGAEAEVRAELERYYGDFSARNWAAFADHFWPGATLTTVWQPPGQPGPMVEVQTVPGFVAKAPEGPGSKPIFEERMTQVEIKVHRNLAQAWARYEARFGDSTKVASWRGIDAITLLRHQDRWRIVSLAFTDYEGDVTDRGAASR
jgi:hypothetical protein